jgi:hypothetical protein
MRRVTQFITSSLETCVAPSEGAYVCTPANHVACSRARPIRAPRLCAPRCCARPSAVRALPPCAPLLPCVPHYRSCPTRHARPPFVPPVCAHRSCSRPTPCAPLQYKFIKIVVHSTTWASRPSIIVRWMTVGCLGGDHSFLIHSHGHIHGHGCMHV